MWVLRKHMADMNPEEALNTLLKNMKGTKDNVEFLNFDEWINWFNGNYAM